RMHQVAPIKLKHREQPCPITLLRAAPAHQDPQDLADGDLPSRLFEVVDELLAMGVHGAGGLVEDLVYEIILRPKVIVHRGPVLLTGRGGDIANGDGVDAVAREQLARARLDLVARLVAFSDRALPRKRHASALA